MVGPIGAAEHRLGKPAAPPAVIVALQNEVQMEQPPMGEDKHSALSDMSGLGHCTCSDWAIAMPAGAVGEQ